MSALATNLSTVVSNINVSTTANNARSLANSLNITLDGVSHVAWSAYNNELGLAETVTNLSQNVSVLSFSLNNLWGIVNSYNASFSASLISHEYSLNQLNQSTYNLSQNYWKTNLSLNNLSFTVSNALG